MDGSSNAGNGALDASQSSTGTSGPSSRAQKPPALGRDASTSRSNNMITSQLSRTDAQSSKQPTPSQLPPSSGASASSSVTSSPLPSREPSPSRSLRASIAAARNPSVGPGTRSRKNSQQDLSPSRPAASTAATATKPGGSTSQKTLSAATTPSLLPVATDSNIKVPIPQKSPVVLENLRDAPRWPVSPRLRSPPPVLHKPSLSQIRKSEQELPPPINFQRPTPPITMSDQSQSDAELDDSHLQPGMRTPARGSASTLETVQEVSPLASPRGTDALAALEKLEYSLISDPNSQPDAVEATTTKTVRPRANLSHNESGSDSGSVNADRRSSATSAPPPLINRQSSTSTATVAKPSGGKGKPNEGTVKTMTVETETVTSIPQVALAPAGIQGSNGSLRTKPSSETIRPKKEKKKTNRKQQTVQPTAASSKADNFEAKIAHAVDEADTSDSEETFVYDSNPPERDRPHPRFHSRTPSATSMASQVDRSGMRSIHSVMEGHGVPTSSVALKKKNKFAVAGIGPTGGDRSDSGFGDDEGSGRGNPGSARGTTVRHQHPHHIGMWGRNNGGNGHTYLFDNESPFIGATRTRLSGNSNARQSSGPPSPRFGNSGRGTSNGKRGPHLLSAPAYDLDEAATGADDERTPLIPPPGSTRSSRSRRNGGVGGRYHHSLVLDRHHAVYRHPPSFLNRMASCLVLTVMLILVVSGAIGFMFATSQPLINVELVSMANMIASEQELMFDMTVKAQNPNVVVVVVDSSDLEIFAKSPHAGTDSEWWRKPRPDLTSFTRSSSSGSFMTRRRRIRGSETPTTAAADGSASSEPARVMGDLSDDPPPLDDTTPNMRLGTIRELDQPFSFEGSFFNKGASVSTGGLRLQRPGNGTDGGSERWERILKDEFDLIIKGVLRYSLPMSQRVRTAAIAGRTKVKPNSANGPPGYKNPKKPRIGDGA